MNLLSNFLTRAKSQNKKVINDASPLENNKKNQKQSILDLPNYVLIQNKDESPPGCSRSSGSSLWQHPDTNRAVCKGNKINNKVEIKYNKAKANFIF